MHCFTRNDYIMSLVFVFRVAIFDKVNILCVRCIFVTIVIYA